MPFVNQPSMAAGEIAPDLYGRVDSELYYIGLRTCRNFIIRQYGGAANRMGTRITAEAKDIARKLRIIDFQFNEVQTYVLELGHQTMRIIKDGGEVLESASAINITGATQANPVVLTVVGHGFSTGQDIFVSGVVGMTELNGRGFRVTVLGVNTVSLQDYNGTNINGTGYAAYGGPGVATRIYTVATPWTEDDIFELSYTQSADVLTVCHQNYATRDITRTAHDNWTVSLFANTEGPFKDTNVTSTSVYSNAATGAVTLTASAALWNANDVGSLFYIKQSPTDSTKTWEVAKAVILNDVRRADFNYYSCSTAGTTGTVKPTHTEGTQTDGDPGARWTYLHSGFGIVQITAFGSSTSVSATVLSRLPDNLVGAGNPSTIWAKAAWSAVEGYPATAAYHKQRLLFGATPNAPNRMWMSGIGARTFFGKSNPILADESITIDLDTTQVNAIRHLLPLTSVIALTSASEQLINGQNDILDATEPPVAKVQGYTGSSRVKPIIIGNNAVYVQDMGSVVRSLQYDLNSDTFTGVDLSARSPHLFKGRQIVDWAYQKHPFSIIWAVLDDGTLLAFTFMQEQKVFAWSRCDTTLGTFESVACIREGNETACYLVVRRVINGVARRFVERFASRTFTDVRDAYFVDCGLSYDGRNTGSKTITISGGTTWDVPETLTLTASAATFVPADIGAQIVFWDYSGTAPVARRLTISAYTSSTVVSAVPTKLITAPYRGVARTDWEFARKNFVGFNHLEGCVISVLADGNILTPLTVVNGKFTLPAPAAVVHAGLGYVSDLETLDMAQPQGQTKAKTLNVPRVFLTVQETRNLWVSTSAIASTDSSLAKFISVKERDPTAGYDAPIAANTTLFEVQTNNSWTNKGRIFIRQNGPVPITINCITPEVVLGMS